MAVEEPKFETALRDGAFEVRVYPALIAAEVVVGGSHDKASSEGFRLLAGYIFGGNTRRQSIAMTAPVVQARSSGQSIAMTAPVVQTGSPGAWTVRFIMPSAYSLDSLPVPNDQRVRLVTLPSTRLAVLRFSGLTRPNDVTRRTAELYAAIAAHRMHAIGPVSLARYDPPWTPWFMRRNEVMAPVQVDAPM